MLVTLINIFAISLIIFVYWFFFGKKKEGGIVVQDNRITIEVAGGYKPDHLVIKRGAPTTLVFHRTDTSDCLEEVVIPEFGVKEHLPVGASHEITITPDKLGTYTISCGMNMYHAKLEVTE